MDTLLLGGDHSLDNRGLPARIDGERELMQRALLRLTIRRGAFPLDPSLGSELHRLLQANPDTWARLALSYAQQALFPMPDVQAESVSVQRGERDLLAVTVTVRYNGQLYPLEVTL